MFTSVVRCRRTVFTSQFQGHYTNLPQCFSALFVFQSYLRKCRDARSARCFCARLGHERLFHAPQWGYVLNDPTMRISDERGTTERRIKTASSCWSDGIARHEALNVGRTTSVHLIIEPKR